MANKTLSRKQREELLKTLRARFEKNMHRHPGLKWGGVEARIIANSKALWSLHEMERTGGEPDVIDHEPGTGQTIFCDCSAESPKDRRGVCYDRAGEKKRNKEGLRPAGNVLDMAAAMGIEPLGEEEYRALQKLGSLTRKRRAG